MSLENQLSEIRWRSYKRS